MLTPEGVGHDTVILSVSYTPPQGPALGIVQWLSFAQRVPLAK